MAKKRIPELRIELINERGNLLYLALVEYKREEYLCVVDNITDSSMGAYVLDYAEQENVPVAEFLSLVTRWFYGSSDKHCLSVELSRNGLTDVLSPIYKTFDTTYISRIVGNAFFRNDITAKTKIRRRRVNPIPEGIAIRLRRNE